MDKSRPGIADDEYGRLGLRRKGNMMKETRFNVVAIVAVMVAGALLVSACYAGEPGVIEKRIEAAFAPQPLVPMVIPEAPEQLVIAQPGGQVVQPAPMVLQTVPVQVMQPTQVRVQMVPMTQQVQMVQSIPVAQSGLVYVLQPEQRGPNLFWRIVAFPFDVISGMLDIGNVAVNGTSNAMTGTVAATSSKTGDVSYGIKSLD